MVETEFKMAFFNQNDKLGMILSYNFYMRNSGDLYQKKDVKIFKPQNEAPNVHEDGTIETVEGFFTAKRFSMFIWVFQLVILSLYALIDLAFRIRLFLFKRQF